MTRVNDNSLTRRGVFMLGHRRYIFWRASKPHSNGTESTQANGLSGCPKADNLYLAPYGTLCLG